jgi:multisubunit Na+/H+ antiporter MnhB subunit
MSFDDNNFDDLGEGELPEESNNNRTFTIAIAILGGIILLSVACLGVFLLVRSRGATAAQQAAATANANGTAQALVIINDALTATQAAALIFPTATSTLPPTATPPVSIETATNTPDPANPAALAPGTSSAATATVGAALTQAAVAQLTIVVTTTALPNTGFADDYGLPGLVVMALAFVVVILLARRLRVSPTPTR